MRNTKLLLSALAIATMVTGCPSPAPTDGGGTDAGMGDTNPMRTDTNVGDSGSDAGITVDCATYCTRITAACTTTHAQYTTMATCMTQCAAAMWTVGAATDTGGNTLGCRIYHAGAAMADPAMHCDHAGPLGGGVCSPFRTDPAVESATATGYVRVDRMGMPAVATVLVGSAMKNAYNDASPADDATSKFVPEFATQLAHP